MATSGLGNLLVEEGLLTEADRRTIRRTSGSRGGAFARGVLALGLLDEDELAAFLAERTRWRVAGKDLLKESLKDAWAAVDRPLMERLEVVPLRISGDTLHIAMLDPLDQDTVRQLEFFTGYRIVPVIATASQLKVGLTKLLKSYKPSQSQLEQFLTNHATSASRRLRIAEDPGTPAKAKAEPVPAPPADLLDDVAFDDDDGGGGSSESDKETAFDDLDDAPAAEGAPAADAVTTDDELIDEGDGGNHLEDMAIGLDDGDTDELEESVSETPAADAAAMPGSGAADVLAAFDDPNDIGDLGDLDDLDDLDDVVDGTLGEVAGEDAAAPAAAAPKGNLAAAVDAAGELDGEGDLSAFDPDAEGGDLDFSFDEEPAAKPQAKAGAAAPARAEPEAEADDLLGGGDDLEALGDLGDDLGGDLAFDEPKAPKKGAAAEQDPLAAVSTKDALAADDDVLAELGDDTGGAGESDDPFAAATDDLDLGDDTTASAGGDELTAAGDDPFAVATDDLEIGDDTASTTADDLGGDDLELEGDDLNATDGIRPAADDLTAADDLKLAGDDLAADDDLKLAGDDLAAADDLKLDEDDPFAAATDDLTLGDDMAGTAADDLDATDDLKLDGDDLAAVTDDLALGDETTGATAGDLGADDLSLDGDALGASDALASSDTLPAADDLGISDDLDLAASDPLAATDDLGLGDDAPAPTEAADDLDALTAQDPFETRSGSDDLAGLSANDDLDLGGLEDDIAVAGPLDDLEPAPAPKPAAKPAAAKPAAAKPAAAAAPATPATKTTPAVTAAPAATTTTTDDAAPSPAVAALNRALWALTMAATVKDGLAKAAPALAASGLARGLVVRISGNKPVPVYYWETAKDGLVTKDKALDAFASPGLVAALGRQFPGWSRLDDNARGDTLKPFAAWRASGELLAAAVAGEGGATLGFITAWTPAAAEDQVLRSATMDVVRKLAGKAA